MTDIVDALGRTPAVGDRVAFGLGKRGAQELVVGHIVNISDKTVKIEHGGAVWDNIIHMYMYKDNGYTTFRKSMCFVIV